MKLYIEFKQTHIMALHYPLFCKNSLKNLIFRILKCFNMRTRFKNLISRILKWFNMRTSFNFDMIIMVHYILIHQYSHDIVINRYINITVVRKCPTAPQSVFASVSTNHWTKLHPNSDRIYHTKYSFNFS